MFKRLWKRVFSHLALDGETETLCGKKIKPGTVPPKGPGLAVCGKCVDITVREVNEHKDNMWKTYEWGDLPHGT